MTKRKIGRPASSVSINGTRLQNYLDSIGWSQSKLALSISNDQSIKVSPSRQAISRSINNSWMDESLLDAVCKKLNIDRIYFEGGSIEWEGQTSNKRIDSEGNYIPEYGEGDIFRNPIDDIEEKFLRKMGMKGIPDHDGRKIIHFGNDFIHDDFHFAYMISKIEETILQAYEDIEMCSESYGQFCEELKAELVTQSLDNEEKTEDQ